MKTETEIKEEILLNYVGTLHPPENRMLIDKLIDLCFKKAIQKRDEEELEWLGNILVVDFSNMDKSEIKNLIKLRHIRKLK